MPEKKKSMEDLKASFEALCQSDLADQQEHFLKSFIFALADWKEVEVLVKAYTKYLADGGEAGKTDLNFVQAADFLQKNGHERTAAERKVEIADVDLDANNRICFLEYLLLHYKVMILTEYYKRTGESHSHDLSKGGKGVSGVGYELLDELFDIPSSLPPELVRALEELTQQKKERAATMADLAEKAGKGGVKGGIAVQQLAAMKEAGISEEMKRTEAKINSALRKCSKDSAGSALRKKKDAEEKEAAASKAKSRAALKAKTSMWENK